MTEVSTIGLDLAKNVFQVHGVDVSGETVIRPKECFNREATMADGAGVQVGFRMGAIDGPATPPEAARRFLTVIAAGVIAAIGGGGRRQGKEGAGLLHGVPQRCSAGVQTDEIEQIAMLVGRGVGPFSGYAWGRQAHEERAPLGTVCVAGCPVSALFAAAGKVAAADVFGPCA